MKGKHIFLYCASVLLVWVDLLMQLTRNWLPCMLTANWRIKVEAGLV